MIGAGDLDRRITIREVTSYTTDAAGDEIPVWEALATVWAAFRAVSDGEKLRAGIVEYREMARFTIRYASDVSGINGENSLIFDGNAWSITGVKEIVRHQWLEISAERAG
ncbi:phage head closure protein [Tropicimonas marinistellae]|uniref:phage head closure protein n=1 Tax=Tropicimonas marinistellae TaxID=1739787 RepID=UPI0008333AE5|nr:phage head closure protein [Tropicimonas marinistellae]